MLRIVITSEVQALMVEFEAGFGWVRIVVCDSRDRCGHFLPGGDKYLLGLSVIAILTSVPKGY